MQTDSVGLQAVRGEADSLARLAADAFREGRPKEGYNFLRMLWGMQTAVAMLFGPCELAEYVKTRIDEAKEARPALSRIAT